MARRGSMRAELSTEIKNMLKEYVVDVDDTVKQITKDLGRNCAKELRKSAAAAVGGNKYSPGWGYEVQSRRYMHQAVIYNKNAPGLAHLLEKGHMMRNGKRSPSYTHIAPVEQQFVKDYEEALINALSGN